MDTQIQTHNVLSFNQAKAKKLFGQGYNLHIAGQIDEAIRIYNESIRWHPTSECYTYMAWAHSAKREYEKAIELCKIAIQLDPDYGNPYNDIGAYLIELGFEDDAIDWLKKAIIARNYDCRFYSYFNLGKVYEDKNMIMKAITCFEQAARINPDFKAAWQELDKLKRRLQ